MRFRSFAAVAAVAVLTLSACGDDDETAGSDTTTALGAAADTTEAGGAETTAAGVATTEAVVETTEAAAATTEAVVETTEAIEAAVETTGAAADTTEAVVETTEAAAATTEAAVETTEAVVETTEAVVETTEAVVETTDATETTEAAAETTEAAAETTEAAAETTEATETTEAAAETTEAAVETTEATETTAAGTETTGPATETTDAGSVPPGELGSITVGSADFPESQLLAQIYGQALEDAGFDVSYELGIGAREAYFGAIDGGEVDLVPEYTNSLLSFLLAPDQPDAANVEEQVTALGEALPEGLEVLTPSSAEDKDTIVCTQDVVDEHSLTDLSSLFAVSGEITIGAPPEFETRTPFGIAGFAENNDAEFAEFVPLAPGDIPAALTAGEIDCGNIFSTDPAIATEGFVALEDDLQIVPNEAVLPLVRSDVVTPELIDALDAVNTELDTETLTDLLSQVVVDAEGADVVADEWLATLE